MIDEFILQMRPFFEKKKRLHFLMNEGGLQVQKNEKFEKMIAEYTGAKHCVVVNNGTISLTLAAMALGIKAGDEVIIPNYTMVATPNSIKMFGGIPIFVDVEETTLCLDINLVEAAITEKTKAVIFVSANGRYPDTGIEVLKALCHKHNLKLIEDAAQSLGSQYPDGCHIGRKGQVGSFSFLPKLYRQGKEVP